MRHAIATAAACALLLAGCGSGEKPAAPALAPTPNGLAAVPLTRPHPSPADQGESDAV